MSQSLKGAQPSGGQVDRREGPSSPPTTAAAVRRPYQRPPSFTDLLPWIEYVPESRCFLLEDGVSVGALFELEPVGTEARTPTFMTQLRDAIQTALTQVIPELDEAPWVLQIYVQDEPSLEGLQRDLAEYPQPAERDSAYTRHYQAGFTEHLARIRRPGGLFEDAAVTGSRWRGQIRRVRPVLYRRLKPKGRLPEAMEVEAALNDVAVKWTAALASAGIRARRGSGEDLYTWLLPYGRSRGAGHPGLVFFNRGAEPLVFDPLHRDDRKKNAYMLILGPTGAGKSALLVYLLQQMAAVYRPRIFVIEAGGSFSLLGQHFQAHGLSVHRVTLNPNTEVSLPPFADALRLLDKERPARTAEDPEKTADDEEDSDEAGSGRDLLGEMEIAARIMITGGDERKDARMTRADRLLIRNAIFLAARTVREAGRDPVLTEDVVAALNAIGRDQQLPEHRRSRAIEMADGIALFCSGLAGHFFDRPGSRWPEADVTLLEMGLLAREGYED